MQLAVGAATAALDAGRTSPRALATLAKERSQGFIDAEPYNTRTWNGVWVIPHLHVDGELQPGRFLQRCGDQLARRRSAAECERADVGGGQ